MIQYHCFGVPDSTDRRIVSVQDEQRGHINEIDVVKNFLYTCILDAVETKMIVDQLLLYHAPAGNYSMGINP